MVHLEHAQVSDDQVHNSDAGDRQSAFFQDFRAAIFRGVFHDRDDAFHSRNEIHRAPRAFDHLAGDHPVRDVSLVRDFEGPENG